MAITCTRCRGTGYLNLDSIDITGEINIEDKDAVLKLSEDISVCDCCGDSEGWYGVPGEHYNSEDPAGHHGPYAYNGGLCECH